MGNKMDSRFIVGSRETDLFDMCRPSALLGFLQSAATAHSVELHYSREELVERHHAIWMLVRMKYTLRRPLRGMEELTIRTWHRQVKGPTMYRDFDILVGDELVGEAVSAWVVADVESHALLRLTSVLPDTDRTAEADCKSETLGKIRIPRDGFQWSEERRMQYSDTDINGHVNNVRYADFFCDAIHLENRRGKYPRSIQINYSAECLPGETITLSAAREDERWLVLGADGQGKARFEAMAELAEANPV